MLIQVTYLTNWSEKHLTLARKPGPPASLSACTAASNVNVKLEIKSSLLGSLNHAKWQKVQHFLSEDQKCVSIADVQKATAHTLASPATDH